MTEKRFTVQRIYKGMDNGVKYYDWCVMKNDTVILRLTTRMDCKDVVEVLNELSEENGELRTKNNAFIQDVEAYREENTHLKLENEQLKQFKEKVFALIDEKIKHYEHKPFSAPVGQPMSVNFDADVDRIARLSELQDLIEELQRND